MAISEKEQERRRKISNALKGKNKGKKLSSEHRRKLSEAHMGKSNGPHSEETKRKIGDAHRGKVMSEKSRRKVSESKKGKIPNRDYTMSEEQKQKLREASKGNKINIGRKHTAQTRANMAAAAKRRWLVPEYREKIFEAWKNPETKKKMLEGCRMGAYAAAKVKENTSIERAIGKVLDSLGIFYVKQKRIGPFIIDFFVPQKRLAIECNGDYWHNRPERKERDIALHALLSRRGFNVVFIWEKDIKKDPWSAFSVAAGGMI